MSLEILKKKFKKNDLKCTARNIFLYTQIPIIVTKYNYSKKIKQLKNKKVINIVFLVNQNQKWKGDILYKKFKTDFRYNPVILVIINKNVEPENDQNYTFFKNRNYNTFAISNLSELITYNPDILFYQQPWGAFGYRNDFSPYKISKHALCVYFPYDITSIITVPEHWVSCKHFYKMLFKQFVINEDCVKDYKKRGVNNITATGHPAFDVYNDPVKINLWKNMSKIKIIYAPHHSFGKINRYATFDWNGKYILQLAKNSLHTEWIFKPHPIFKSQAVKAGILTQKEADDYFKEWEQTGQIYDMGDYYDIFRTSDMLITDCDAFLTEYLPTKNPVIHLIPAKEPIWSSVSCNSSKHYYKIHNLAELENTYNMLVNKNNDPLKSERHNDALRISLNSSDNIINEISKYLFN